MAPLPIFSSAFFRSRPVRALTLTYRAEYISHITEMLGVEERPSRAPSRAGPPLHAPHRGEAYSRRRCLKNARLNATIIEKALPNNKIAVPLVVWRGALKAAA